MNTIIIAGNGYAAFYELQKQVKRNIKRLDRQITLINYSKPLSLHDQQIIKKRLKQARLNIYLIEKMNEIVDNMPMPEGLCC